MNSIRGGAMGGDEYRVLNMPRCRVWRSAGTPLSAGTAATVSFDTVEYDTDSMASAVGVFITCQTPGLYAFQGQAVYPDGTPGPFWTRILKNNSTLLPLAADTRVDAAFRGVGIATLVSLSGFWTANKGDTIQLYLYSNSAITATGGQYNCFLSACLISTLG